MSSKIKVDNIADQGNNNLLVKCGSTLTIGATGNTVTLASGASQSGFGRTGTVDWQTGSIKTTTFTAANGEGYFVDTSSGAITMNLPAGTAGNIVSVADYTNTFQTHNLTISPNGSQKIGGVNASVILNTEGQSVTLVYVDDTEGWKNVQDSTSNVLGNPNIVATGGTVTTSGNYKIHTFTGPGTFSVTNASSTAANNIVSYLVVAGGASGGSSEGGGGGAGGFREYKGPADCYSASPLNGNPGGTAITISAQDYPITVGGGGGSRPGSPSSQNGESGSNSIFSTITSAGGGGGGSNASPGDGLDGGSGGGSRRDAASATSNGSGNTPPTTPAQGNNGGSTPASDWHGAGGGGGATAVGGNGSGNSSPSGEVGGPGGAGATTSITASPVAYAGGGGGSINGTSGTIGTGGTGGGGNGSQPPACATAGTINTGGGGGGATGKASGGGGSGVVIIRYKFQ